MRQPFVILADKSLEFPHAGCRQEFVSAHKLDRRVADRHRLPEDAEGRYSRVPVEPRHIRRAEIYDISYSGIAFRISSDTAPLIGELVAIEFQILGGPRMAWYAQVIRLEIEQSSENPEHHAILKVGARFLELPPLRRRQLEKQIDALMDRAHENQPNRIRIFTEALQIRRSHEITLWRWVRVTLLLAASIGAGIWILLYIKGIGSSELRTNRPPIWPGYQDHAPTTSPLRESENALDATRNE